MICNEIQYRLADHIPDGWQVLEEEKPMDLWLILVIICAIIGLLFGLCCCLCACRKVLFDITSLTLLLV